MYFSFLRCGASHITVGWRSSTCSRLASSGWCRRSVTCVSWSHQSSSATRRDSSPSTTSTASTWPTKSCHKRRMGVTTWTRSVSSSTKCRAPTSAFRSPSQWLSCSRCASKCERCTCASTSSSWCRTRHWRSSRGVRCTVAAPHRSPLLLPLLPHRRPIDTRNYVSVIPSFLLKYVLFLLRMLLCDVTCLADQVYSFRSMALSTAAMQVSWLVLLFPVYRRFSTVCLHVCSTTHCSSFYSKNHSLNCSASRRIRSSYSIIANYN